MNDRYLFRGKRTQNKMWVIGNLTAVTDDVMRIATETQNTKGYYVIPRTVGQCTGLRDKNGNLIFEGDIIKYFHKKNFHVGIIRWFDDICGFKLTNECDSFIEDIVDFDVEIIGNIHDNPELLKCN